MSKPHICLIYTGGTIGMIRLSDGTLKPPEEGSEFLKLAPELKDIVDFTFFPIMNKDSTNLNPNDWTLIANSIYNHRNEGFDGFVIVHGTDTMHFSASAVSFALGGNLNFPVVFTGAQTIPEILHGDAKINLFRACKVASIDLAEVVISFGDFVFRGCRAQKKDERRFDAFESPSFPPLAYITEEIIDTGFSFNKENDRPDIELNAKFESNILQVSLIPGLEPEMIYPVLDSQRLNGLILQSFGAGNVPSESPFSFSELIQRATDLHTPVIITSQFPAGATLHTSYEPGRTAISVGAIPTGNMTASCATAKFRWVLADVESQISQGNVKEDQRIELVKKMMNTVFVGEMDIDNIAE